MQEKDLLPIPHQGVTTKLPILHRHHLVGTMTQTGLTIGAQGEIIIVVMMGRGGDHGLTSEITQNPLL